MRPRMTASVSGDARVTISRVSSNAEENFIQIEIEDDTSSCARVVAKMSLADFAKAVTLMGCQHARAQWIRPDLLGLRHEVKDVDIPGLYYDTPQEVWATKVGEHETDGWIADTRSAEDFNHHRQDAAKGYRMTFRRWVS